VNLSAGVSEATAPQGTICRTALHEHTCTANANYTGSSSRSSSSTILEHLSIKITMNCWHYHLPFSYWGGYL